MSSVLGFNRNITKALFNDSIVGTFNWPWHSFVEILVDSRFWLTEKSPMVFLQASWTILHVLTSP
jgi:hypothetical protein